VLLRWHSGPCMTRKGILGTPLCTCPLHAERDGLEGKEGASPAGAANQQDLGHEHGFQLPVDSSCGK
jgi:hypothetical protein